MTSNGKTIRELVQDPSCKPYLSGDGEDPLATFVGSGFTGDGKWHAAVSANGPIFLQDYSAAAATPPAEDAPGGSSGSSRLKDLASSLVTFNPTGLSDHAATTCLAFRTNPASSVSNSYIAATAVSTGTIELWNFNPELTTRKVRSLGTVTEAGNEPLTVSFAPDGNSLVTAGSDKCIRLYAVGDVSYGGNSGSALKLVVEYKAGIDRHGQDTLAPNNRIFTAKHMSSSVFLVAGWESLVLVYDTRAATAAQGGFKGPHVSGNSLDVDPSRNMVVVGSDRLEGSQLDFFDMRKLRTGTPTAEDVSGGAASAVDPACVQSMSGLGLRILTTKFSADGKSMMAGGAEENCVLFAARSGSDGTGEFQVEGRSKPLPQTIYGLAHNEVKGTKSARTNWVGVGAKGYSVRFVDPCGDAAE